MKEFRYTFVEYERTGGVHLGKCTGNRMEIRAQTPLEAAERIAFGFIALGQKAEVFPNGPTIYPLGVDTSEVCWQLLEVRTD